MNGHESNFSRRQMLQHGMYGASSLLLANTLARAASQGVTPARPNAKAKSVIQIWMWGGPAHTDTFDPKPEAGYDYCGPLDQTAKTNVDGIRIGQLLPELAKMADKYSIIRSMTHGVNAHETASYMVQTGRKSGGRDVFPCAGAVVSLFKGYGAGYEGLIPPYIVLTRPQGRFSEAGFLGARYKPFATGGNPGASQFLVEGVAAPGITRPQQVARRDLLHQMDALSAALKDDPRIKELRQCEDKAYDLIVGEAGKVFDPTEEPEELRNRYGRTTFGQSCLVARRLVEYGVPYVTINYTGWDTHKQHFQAMRRKLPELDKGMSTLIADLDQRGLLDSTIVWWGGEFGRTPKVQWQPPWNGGRGHFGRAFSSVVAGGGFKGGRVVGETNATGEHVEKDPVHPWDLTGSMYELLGIDPQATLPHPQGKEIRVTPADGADYLKSDHLRQIM